MTPKPNNDSKIISAPTRTEPIRGYTSESKVLEPEFPLFDIEYPCQFVSAEKQTTKKMQREIKFRLWDGVENVFFCSNDLEYSASGVNASYLSQKPEKRQTFERLSILFNVRMCARNWEHPDTTIEQYTGLKDKNGKEIYEGDLVQLFNEDDIKYEVVFEDGMFVLDSEEGYGDWFQEKNREIVGNIHELN